VWDWPTPFTPLVPTASAGYLQVCPTAHNPNARCLHEYDAADAPVATLPGAPPLALSPFGPMLARTRLPDALIQSFNDYADAHADPARSTGFRLSQEVIHAGGDAALAQQVTQLIAPIWRAWKARW